MSDTENKHKEVNEPTKVEGVVILANFGNNYLKKDKTLGVWDSTYSIGNSNQLRVWTLEQARQLYSESKGTGDVGEDGWKTVPTEVLEATWETGHTNPDGIDIGTKLTDNRFTIFDYLLNHPEKAK